MSEEKITNELRVEAMRICKQYDLDNHIRRIAKAGEFDGTANWGNDVLSMEFRCTDGAGTNSASVKGSNGKLYVCGGYGRYIERFKPGSWVAETVKLSEKIQKDNEEKEEQARVERDKLDRENWSPV